MKNDPIAFALAVNGAHLERIRSPHPTDQENTMNATTRITRAQLEAALQQIQQARSLAQIASQKDCELADLIDDEVCNLLIDAEGAAMRLLAIARFKP